MSANDDFLTLDLDDRIDSLIKAKERVIKERDLYSFRSVPYSFHNGVLMGMTLAFKILFSGLPKPPKI